MLRQAADVEWSDLDAVVPPHCEDQVGQLARSFAARWLELARRLEERGRPA
ncbi:hypothetical protein [Kitasatospora purpeofusca]|uniref:hypothetical protein n=1 Tax=Kitasatospora purpeofusca TaxID=67352 RepID=UPI003662B257